ncbi:MAG: orotate phosphoribosyltransferase [Chlamydiales bacterium]
MLIQQLYEIGAINFGEFTLKSGMLSPIYVDLRLIISYPTLLQEIAEKMWEKVEHKLFQRVCGVPYTALPIATALSLQQNLPMVMRRKEVKNYGMKKIIEGAFEYGQNCLVIEDLITSGLSIFETIEPLEKVGLKVTDIIVLLDREQGGKQFIEDKGYHLHSLFTMTDFLHALKNQMSPKDLEFIERFIKENQC